MDIDLRKEFCYVLEEVIDGLINNVINYASKEYSEAMWASLGQMDLLLDIREKLCKEFFEKEK